MTERNSLLRQLPQVNELVENNGQLQEQYGRQAVVEAARETLEMIRQELRTEEDQGEKELVKPEKINHLLALKLKEKSLQGLRRVINGTGVVLHTNLGRAVLPQRAAKKLAELAGTYSNLELSLESGRRGERYVHSERLLQSLTGAESALVVNNNAAAVLLSLNSLAKEKEIIVSRGQLVEVGGGFRIPEVMAWSGAKIREVGTTNKTYLADYEQAITENTGAILYVHPSNYRLEGFTHQAGTAELAKLAQEREIPFLVDAGSGVLLKKNNRLWSSELSVSSLIAEGADLISFSGDKLLGGPQAGIIVGKKKRIDQLKTNQLLRALRVDKLTLAALEETLKLYLNEERALKEIPLWRAFNLTEDELHRRAELLVSRLEDSENRSLLEWEVADGCSLPGGGTLPGIKLPTKLVVVRAKGITPPRLGEILRTGEPAVMVRVEEKGIMIDMRTILNDRELGELADCLLSAASQERRGKSEF